MSISHGYSNHRLYYIWISMINRCSRPTNGNYILYGLRGITVCERWLDINNFIEDMYPTFKDGLTLDRIDVNGNYTKDNCRWATQLVQANNTRMNVKVPGTELTLAEYARENNINYHTVQSAVYKQRNPTRRKKERCTK